MDLELQPPPQKKKLNFGDEENPKPKPTPPQKTQGVPTPQKANQPQQRPGGAGAGGGGGPQRPGGAGGAGGPPKRPGGGPPKPGQGDRPAPNLSRNLSRMGQSSMRQVTRTVTRLGEAESKHRKRMHNNAMIRKEHFERSMKLLESNPTTENLKKANFLKTFVQKQLEHRMEGHKPRFTLGVTFIQFVLIAVMMVFGKLSPFGMSVTTQNFTVDLLNGTAIQPISKAGNPYFGPSPEDLVYWGSKWAPCMREENTINEIVKGAQTWDTNLGCCKVIGGKCGMTTHSACDSYGGEYRGVGERCSTWDQCESIHLRPCCYGIMGACNVTTKMHCDALNGQWRDDSELCSDDPYACVYKICGMFVKYTGNKGGTTNPNQFYRFTTAIFLHVGVIHFIMNALGQYVLVAQIEFVAGFWRTLLMYVVSGTCGFMISAIFSADQLSNGSSAAIYGMLGVETVDLFQTWQLLENKAGSVFQLIIKLIIFLGIGTLPFIDNFAHVGGFIGGVVSGLWLLPYIVFGSLDGARKKVVQFLAFFGMIGICIGVLYKFYIDKATFCSFCKYINCVPYTPGMCDSQGG
eukprot:c19538_g1_i1.p1 GENE.c19538_g1_i1~~c19538_g1_i1.p1  ORF type:complete len:575 (+),score=236.91 c19538_g1_i1:65-1789(+)